MARQKEKFKTEHTVFDEFTNRNLFKLITEGHFDGLESPLSVGKESNIFTAKKGDGWVIVKIYRLETCDFNRMYDYIKLDPRFLGLKNKKRKVILAWVQREFRNLLKAREAGVKVPIAYAFQNNIIVLELIGDGEVAPKLKDSIPTDKKAFAQIVIQYMKRLFRAGMVHGDLSGFNILNLSNKPVFIDFSQSTTSDSPIARELLERDVKNVCSFFNRHGLKLDQKKVMEEITS